MNIEQALAYGREQLTSSPTPDVDSSVLLRYVLDCTQTYLLTWPDKPINEQQQNQFEQFLIQRQQGQPVAYITGERGFWSLDLEVTKDTLIPRPDTELIVSLALEKLTVSATVIDIGTGTGAIALALASELPQTQIVACDFSWPALLVAQKNATKNDITNVHFVHADWLTAFAENSVDLIVSNPPYIEQNDPHLQQGDVRFEPITALTSGADGLDDIRLIIQQAIHCLKPQGWLLIEHGYHQSQQVQTLLKQAGFEDVNAFQDFGGNDRVAMAQLTL